MITVKSLKAILDSIEQSTGNPETLIIFDIDHGPQPQYETYCKDKTNTIQSVNMNLNLDIDPEDPQPQEKPDFTCVITLE